MSIEVLGVAKTPLRKAEVVRWAGLIRRELKRRQLDCPLEIVIAFLDPRSMKLVNQRHRGKDKATDVLSFLSQDEPSELLICPKVIASNARRGDFASRMQATRWGQRQEYLLVLIHGFLHLAGMDHSPEARDQEPMMRLQFEIFRRLDRT